MLKSVCIYTVLAKANTTQVLNPWHLPKKFGSAQWPIAQYEFEFEKLGEFETEFENFFVK
jgi:hypothetical protein